MPITTTTTGQPIQRQELVIIARHHKNEQLYHTYPLVDDPLLCLIVTAWSTVPINRDTSKPITLISTWTQLWWRFVVDYDFIVDFTNADIIDVRTAVRTAIASQLVYPDGTINLVAANRLQEYVEKAKRKTGRRK
jgi:hypothetical protein